MKKKSVFIKLAPALLLMLSACVCTKTNKRTEVIATYTEVPVKIDGKLDEEMWKKTPMYVMKHSLRAWNDSPKTVREFFQNGVVGPGYIRLLWDKDYLYVGVEFIDDDIVAEGKADEEPHFQLGDVAEVFMKPVNKPWYWELYVTPLGHKTSYFYKYPGRGWIPSFMTVGTLTKMRTAASVSGTLNNLTDKDRKWTAEMAIPVEQVSDAGEKLSPEVPWLIFFGRYNYSYYLPEPENSSFPYQERGNYHFLDDYGILKMVK